MAVNLFQAVFEWRNLQTQRLSGPKAAPASFIKCRLSIAPCVETPNEKEIRHERGR